MVEVGWTCWIGLTGLLIGSFLNVCIFRLPRDCMSIVRPRSRCIRCLSPIAVKDNIPVLSWLLLRGRCRGCREPISVRYPLVELMTGGIFFWVAAQELVFRGAPPNFASVVWLAGSLSMISALIVCSFVDLDFRIIPDEISYGGLALALAVGLAFPEWHILRGTMATIPGNVHVLGLATSLVGAAVGAGIIWATRILGELIFRKEAMGLGDVKLMGFIGAALGWQDTLMTLMLGSIYGTVIGLVQLILVRESKIPFGPFLSLGAVTMLLARDEVYRLLARLQDWWLTLVMG